MGKTQGILRVISDGSTLWEEMKVDGQERVASRAELARIIESLEQSTVSAQARAELFQEMCISGLAPWLQSLRNQMTVIHQETASWNMHDVLRLTLAWKAPIAAALAPPGQPWPAYLPRKCLLYLDAETHWPYRMEWWGPGKRPDRETQIYQVELREPVFTQVFPARRCAKEFTLEPGPDEVPDCTQAYTDAIEARAQQVCNPANQIGQNP
jgi:hypothetical protein